jgi:hypothetical protein
MTNIISKSFPENLSTPKDGNALNLYIDYATNQAYIKDIYGNISPLGTYLPIPPTVTLDNIGTGAEIYVDASGTSPAELRTITQGANVVITQNANDIEIAAPNIVGTPLYYGSFYSTQTQTTVGSEQKAMTFNNTDATATLGFSIVSNSQITAANTGIYNIAFSAQLRKTSGGGATQIYIWIKKNGVNLTDSNTTLTLANNGDLLVAAWNLFLQLNAGQYVELFWYATSANIQLYYNATPVVGLPDIPSVIATINRIG